MRLIKKLFRFFTINAVILAGICVAAIMFGGPKSPPPMTSIDAPFMSVDFSDLPEISHFTAMDGVSLAYRYYSPASATPRGSVVLVHGSSARSTSMHLLAKAFAKVGYAAYVLDRSSSN
jgi:hypothetical protein